MNFLAQLLGLVNDSPQPSQRGNQLQPSGRNYEDQITARRVLQPTQARNGQRTQNGNFLQGMASRPNQRIRSMYPDQSMMANSNVLNMPQDFDMYGMPGLSLQQPQFIQERERMPYQPLNRI